MALVRRARGTRFGQEHGFLGIADVEAFQQRVPLRRYEAFWREYWSTSFPRVVDATWPGLIPFFALTSGTTTGDNKHIPVSHAMIGANRRAALDVLCHHVHRRPDSAVLSGRNFVLGGSTALRELAAGVRAGDLSGIAAVTVPLWARPYTFPPPALALMPDWEEKVARLAPASLTADIRSISGTPSWLLPLFDRLAALRPGGGELADVYPKLELLIHGGVNFAPYRRRFEKLLAGSKAETREVYPASEGFIAIADRGDGEGLRLILDNGLFFEFVPVPEIDRTGPTRHWIATVEPGVEYALIVSSCAGLWAYVLGDTVRLVEQTPPRLLVTGRLGHSLSAFGEHLIGDEIDAAVAAAAMAIKGDVVDYSVGPLFPGRPGELGRHLFIVEFAEPITEATRLRQFVAVLDETLARRNADYRDHRARDFSMAAPLLDAVPRGTFTAWMRRRGQLGGQHKVPRVIAEPELWHDLRRFASAAQMPASPQQGC